MDIRLDGRAALITGGSQGIGLGIAVEYARSGADVAIVARRPAVLAEAKAAIERSARGRVVAVSADVSTAEGCKAAFDGAKAALGKVDILVNNAGSSARGAFEDLTDAAWQADLDLKLFAAVRLCRLALPEMRERRWGRIVNVIMIGAKAPVAGQAPTAVSRAAGMSLTKILASEYAPHNVLVNAVLVGKIESNQWERRSQREKRPLAEIYAEIGAEIPLGRVGTAAEFANVACFLASDAASYVTGTAINIDGGACPVV